MGEKDAILAAIELEGSFPEDADEKWLRDMDIIRALASVEPWNYEGFPEEIQNDREIALECVKLRGDVYEYLPKELLADEEIMEEAVLHGLSLKKINPKTAEKLLCRADLVHTAIEENDGNEMIYADKTLWEKKELAELALDRGFCHLRHLPEELASDKESVKRVIRNMSENSDSEEYWQIKYLPEQLRFDKDFLLELITLQEKVLQAIVQWQKNPIAEEESALFPKLDADFCKKAYAANKKCLKFMSKEMKAAVKE
ncbi:MAG: DUF4116 domain-containing protein [Lachnospiraceae bacterium]|nr:DUF4116 domain-containing protein [Lachnospiraceae bacterium]